MLRTIERPTKATLRPCACGGVEHLLHAVHVRGEAGHDDPALRPGANTRSSTGPMSRSDVVKPGTSAFVESTMNRSTPSSPSRANARRSVMRPSSGSWSILKSPVCSTVPAAGADGDGQRVGDRVVDGDELAARTARTARSAPPDRQRVAGVIRCSLSFASTKRERELGPDQRDVGRAAAAGTGPRRCGPRGRASGRRPTMSSRRSRDGREVGQDQVDARLVVLGEEHPAVDDEQLAAVSSTAMLRPTSPRPPSGDDPQAVGRERWWRPELGVG